MINNEKMNGDEYPFFYVYGACVKAWVLNNSFDDAWFIRNPICKKPLRYSAEYKSALHPGKDSSIHEWVEPKGR